MKHSIFALVMLFGSTAFACPDYSGTWDCTATSGQMWTTTYTQEAIPGGVHYTATGYDGKQSHYYGDGEKHVSPPNEEGVVLTSIGLCDGNYGLVVKEEMDDLSGDTIVRILKWNIITPGEIAFSWAQSPFSGDQARCLKQN